MIFEKGEMQSNGKIVFRTEGKEFPAHRKKKLYNHENRKKNDPIHARPTCNRIIIKITMIIHVKQTCMQL